MSVNFVFFCFVFYSVLKSIWSGRGRRHQTLHSSRDSSMTSGSASTTGTGVEGEFQNSRGGYRNVSRDNPGGQQKEQKFSPLIQSVGLTNPQLLHDPFSAADSADLDTGSFYFSRFNKDTVIQQI